MPDNSKISTYTKENTWCVCFQDELTRNEETVFFQTYPWLASFHESKDILFDFTNTRYINSAGIALLIRYVREARQKEYFCYAVGVSSHYQKIFRIVGLSSYIENFPDAFSFFERMRLRRSYSNER